MIENINSIRLMGRIASEPRYDHTILGEAFYIMEVAAKRLSGYEDVLPVTVSERLLGDASVNACEVGTLIDIIGQVRSYNQFSEGKSKLIITVFARDICFLDDIPAPADPSEETETGEEEPDESPDEKPGVAPLNEVVICGTVCKPVIYRTTPFSREIADVLIAVNRRYGKSDYLPCIAWGRNARYADGLQVGDIITIHGRLQSRAYQKTLPDGNVEQRVAYEISCSAIEKHSF